MSVKVTDILEVRFIVTEVAVTSVTTLDNSVSSPCVTSMCKETKVR